MSTTPTPSNPNPEPPAPTRPPPKPPVERTAAPPKPPVTVLRGTIVGYLAGNPIYYRIRPDKVNGVQPLDVHAENPLNHVLPLRRRVDYILNEHSGPPNAPGLVTIVSIWGFWAPMPGQEEAEFTRPGNWYL